MPNYLFKEKMEVCVEYHPHHKSLNKKILEEAKEFYFERELYNGDGGATNVKAVQTRSGIISPTTELLRQWVLRLVIENLFPRIKNLYVHDLWMAVYDKGDYTTPHTHRPSMFAFVYFVKAPPGSAPLVFHTSGKRVKAEEGKIIIFPGYLVHSVPKNKCKGRIVLSGNVSSALVESSNYGLGFRYEFDDDTHEENE